MKNETKTIAVINGSKILVIEGGEKLVPIKPICEALGVDFANQKVKIESDEILGSTVVLSTTVAADGKQREMVCIPFEFVFGWLFTINPANVKEEARASVVQYKRACYKALYRSFTEMTKYLDERGDSVRDLRVEHKEVKTAFNECNKRLKDVERRLDEAINMTFEDWLRKKRQLGLFDQEYGNEI